MSAIPNHHDRAYSSDEVAARLLAVAKDPAAYIATLIESQAHACRRELWDLARLENLARGALSRPERFSSEHQIATDYLTLDVPRRQLRLNAALHVLDFGPPRMKRDFVLGDEATRQRLLEYVIRRGGIYHRRHRNDERSAWVELPA